VILTVAASFAAAALVIHAQNPPAAPAPSAQPSGLQPPASRLENLRQLSSNLYSGGEPHGDAAFAELAGLGVRTIVSVDGARPDVEAARAHGIRYVHIPIGYDGVDAQAQAALTRVVREIEGPVFLHCHHGKHRGPAAAAIMCMAAGHMDHDKAQEFLKGVGTSRDYVGLWRDVRSWKPLPADAMLPDLVEVAAVESLPAAMAQLDRAWDGVQRCQAAGWKTPPDHADIAPPHQALLVWEGLRESRRTLDGSDETLVALMEEAERRAEQLRQSLEAGRTGEAGAALKQLENSCNKCHAAYRN
jgi:protein tyrosine phosphatase (PTP) superfamily phosphohydrolase (DUF442 family)